MVGPYNIQYIGPNKQNYKSRLLVANIMLYVVTILIVNSGLGAMMCLNFGRKTVETSTSVNSDANQRQKGYVEEEAAAPIIRRRGVSCSKCTEHDNVTGRLSQSNETIAVAKQMKHERGEIVNKLMTICQRIWQTKTWQAP